MSLSWHSQVTAFSHVYLKGSSNLYLCGQCIKSTSNWDTMGSHYLQEHFLRIFLVCPHYGMRYLGSINMLGSFITCCFINLKNDSCCYFQIAGDIMTTPSSHAEKISFSNPNLTISNLLKKNYLISISR